MRTVTLALALLALAPAAASAQADRTISAGESPTFTFDGDPAFGTNVTTELGEPMCSKAPLTYCDTTLIELKKAGLYTFATDVPDTSDIDTALFASDATGARGKLLKEGSGFIGDDETFAYDADPGFVLFVAAYYFSLADGFKVNGTFEPATAEVPAAPAAPSAPAPNKAPEAKISKLAKSSKASKVKSFKGTAADADGKVAKVEIALVKLGKSCKQMTSKGKFVAAKKCQPTRFLRAKGTSKWSYKLRKRLSKGKYRLYARATDNTGARQAGFSPASKKSFTVR